MGARAGTGPLGRDEITTVTTCDLSSDDWDRSLQSELRRLGYAMTPWRKLSLLDMRRPDPLPLPPFDLTPRLRHGEAA
jgi:hypothetical protein